MKLRHFVCWLLLAIVSSSLSRAQGNSATAIPRGVALVKAAKSADDAWAVVEEFVRKRTDLNNKLDPSDPDAFSPADLYVEASLAANAFYTTYSGHGRASEATKLEATYALHAAQLGAPGYKQKAAALASAYRADKKNSDHDRFDVAFLMDGNALADKLNGKRFLDDGVQYERLADTLYSEFGDTPELYGLYVSIARTTDVATAMRVANKVLGYKKVPGWARELMEIIVERSKLIGKSLNLKLTTIGGDTIDLSVPGTKPTVVYLWSTADGFGDSLATIEHFKPSFKTDARWIYVGLGGALSISDGTNTGPFAKAHCYVQPQFGNSVTNYLKVNQAPYAFVLNAAGHLVGYGFPENIAGLLEAANH